MLPVIISRKGLEGLIDIAAFLVEDHGKKNQFEIYNPEKPCHNTFSLSLLFLPPFCLAFLLASFPSDDRKGGTSRKEYSLVRARLLTP